MRRDLELSLPDSCINRAAPDEPVFVLRAKDPIASSIVRAWALRAKTVHEREKIDEAIELAHSMDSWRLDHLKSQT
jgi:hypothetical protein